MARILAFLFILLPTFTYAQTYPDYESIYVNDYANIIDEQTEKRLTDQLTALRQDHDVEATVLTIGSRKTYGDSPSLEYFATGLFNEWGIGNSERNDGILILVIRDDREMRVELGSGYGSGFNRVAKETIENYFLPSFRNGNYARGIERGTTEIIRRIALPFAKGKPEPVVKKSSRRAPKSGLLVAIFLLVPVFLIGLTIALFSFRRQIRKLWLFFSKCPNCGRYGLRTIDRTLKPPTKTSGGEGLSITTCLYCDYSDSSTYTISRLPDPSDSSDSSRGSFGGGSSSGGGASGRW